MTSPIKCLDFDNLSQWHQDFIKSTTITRPPSDQPVSGLEAQPGDTVAVNAGGVVGEAVVLVNINPCISGCARPTDGLLQQNSPEVFQFAYTGRKMGLAAVRTFRFMRDSTGGGTVFKHSESWEGYMAVLFMAFSPMRYYVRGLFEGFNRDLKKAVKEERM